MARLMTRCTVEQARDGQLRVGERKGVTMKQISGFRSLVLVAACLGLNLGMGFIVTAMKLPLYLDSVGTVVATAVGGLGSGLICGILSVIIGSAYTPTLWAYAGTMMIIAVYVSLVRPMGYLDRLLPTVLLGIGLGGLCAVISSPVTTYLWKGVSLSGTDSLAAFFSAKGMTLLVSVILANLATDPIDKLLTSLAAFALLNRIAPLFSPKPTMAEPKELNG
jgi:energy-coupling factor transport system substrate-specific component